MNKNTIYIVLALVIGLIGGYFLFSGSDSAQGENIERHDHTEEATAQMWTCSMHPQIMLPEPGDCPICGMELIPAGSTADGLALNQFKMSKNALALANIETTVVGNGGSNNSMTLSGKIQQNEEENSVQSSYFAGRIENLNVNFTGEEVRQGQRLATIYSPQLVAAQQELITTASLKESQPELYKAVRNKLKLWKLSENQINQIENSGKVTENFPIYATVSGTVSEKLVNEGDYVKQGEPLFRIANLNTVWAVFDAYENQLSQLKNGQEIKISANAYPGKTFDAKVSFIDPSLNTGKRTVQVRAELNNNESNLKPGMFVQGKISRVATAEETITVPASAVMWTGKRSLVYIKTDDTEPVFEMREVQLGNTSGDNYTILSGLSSGDEIVTNGTFTVDAAAQLQGKKSMMNAGEEAMPGMKMNLPADFQQKLGGALDSYLQLKDALVASKAELASAKAKTLQNSLEEIETASASKMLQAHIKASKNALAVIDSSTDLKIQRDNFYKLSENMIALAENLTTYKDTLFVQKCPMANNSEGASWLSKERDVRNPYFGEAMLTCGSVIQTLTSK
ncbi:MAG: efflux RND transporter periplasmic adaptor subunit [Leeuwenhoekiella sp.]